jgi:hypothetical protein
MGTQDNRELRTSALSFDNNYALQPDMRGMPEKDFTVEFWAQTPPYNESDKAQQAAGPQVFRNFFSYATHLPDASKPFCT